MKKREAQFATELNKWLNYNGESIIGESCPIECKVSVDDKPFNIKSGFKEHQIPTLNQARRKVHAYKLSDEDQKQKPYDIAFFCKAPSLIAIMWIRRGNKRFYLIEPGEIIKHQELGHKSLDEKSAMIIAKYTGWLK